MVLAVVLQRHISIHAPHEGERHAFHSSSVYLFCNFNPRSPRGGATIFLPHGQRVDHDFNPRSPRGGATRCRRRCSAGRNGFQSTLPTRGSDLPFLRPITINTSHFNPRSPRGGATDRYSAQYLIDDLFQSTLPTRGSDSGKVHLYAAFQRIC